MSQQNPKGWKTYDEFACGIDTNRLPATNALDGRSFNLSFDDGRKLELSLSAGTAEWSDDAGSDRDKSEV